MQFISDYPVIDLAATGRNILRLRKSRGLSVKNLQEFFGFEAPQAVYKWQRGEALPTVDNLFALSTLFNVSMNEILVCCTSKTEQPASEQGCSVLSFVFGLFAYFSGKRYVFV